MNRKRKFFLTSHVLILIRVIKLTKIFKWDENEIATVSFLNHDWFIKKSNGFIFHKEIPEHKSIITEQ